MLISECIGLILIIFLAGIDLKYQRLPEVLLLVCSVLVGCFRIWHIRESAMLWIVGSVIGITFFLISKCTKEAFGYGDSWVILLLGIFLGARKVLALLTIAFFLSLVVGGILLIRSKWSRKKTIPFLPFLAIGYLGVLII